MMASPHPEGAKQVNGVRKHDKDYGTPVAGSKTEARAKLAHERISREILEMCCVIEDNGKKPTEIKDYTEENTNSFQDDAKLDYINSMPYDQQWDKEKSLQIL